MICSGRRVRKRWLAIGLLLGAVTACAAAAPAAESAPAPAPEGELLAPERIAALVPAAERDAWLRYLEESRRQRETDRAAIAAEIEQLGRERWTPATEGPAFYVTDEMTVDWFRGEEARRLAENILSYQTPSGGWSKRVDLRQPRQPGESYSSASGWSYIATFDNDATTEHLRFLAEAFRATGEERYRESFLRGLEYIFRAQYPNGCWPQVYPLQGSYHDAATFNDEAIANILRLLRDVAAAEDDLVPETVRRRVEASLQRGIECVLASQVVVNGRRTVWGAQHDPLTLQPVKARAYEHASLSGGESVDLMEFLMGLDSPDPRVVEAVHAAAAWFRETAIYGYEYEAKSGLVAREGAGPIWARFYEIGTNRPIFSNRDGTILYDWHELDEERRRGYARYRTGAADVLRRYERWARALPRSR